MKIVLIILFLTDFNPWPMCHTIENLDKYDARYYQCIIQGYRFSTAFCDGVEMYKPDGAVWPDGVCLAIDEEAGYLKLWKKQDICGEYKIHLGLRYAGRDKIIKARWRVIPKSKLNYHFNFERAVR